MGSLFRTLPRTAQMILKVSRLSSPQRRNFLLGWLPGFFLFATTAAIVIWQNSRLAVLWDISYILENATRISLGNIPYRDFPFPYAPLTFLIQTALIKLTGRVFWHTIAYCAIVGATASVLTWRIAFNLLRRRGRYGRLVAFVISVPICILGIYCVYPHPFYDSDCTFIILLSVLLMLKAERARNSWLALIAGGTIVIPLFTKQNPGLAFFLSSVGSVVIVTMIQLIRRQSIVIYASVIAGAVIMLATATLLIHFIAGLTNYLHWTIQFAAARRMPAVSEMIGVYAGKANLLWLGTIATGVILLRLNRAHWRSLEIVSVVLISIPFLWP